MSCFEPQFIEMHIKALACFRQTRMYDMYLKEVLHLFFSLYCVPSDRLILDKIRFLHIQQPTNWTNGNLWPWHKNEKRAWERSSNPAYFHTILLLERGIQTLLDDSTSTWFEACWALKSDPDESLNFCFSFTMSEGLNVDVLYSHSNVAEMNNVDWWS